MAEEYKPITDTENMSIFDVDFYPCKQCLFEIKYNIGNMCQGCINNQTAIIFLKYMASKEMQENFSLEKELFDIAQKITENHTRLYQKIRLKQLVEIAPKVKEYQEWYHNYFN